MEYLQCNCIDPISSTPTCPISYTFRYTGARCNSPLGGGGDDVLSCTESRNFDMPKQATIIAKDSIGGSEISRATGVQLGKEVTFFGRGVDGCIPDVMDFEIRDDVNLGVILQTMTVNTQCTAGGIQLTDSAGALQFTGYACDGGKEENCLESIVLEACAQNIGAIPMKITDLVISFDDIATSPLAGYSPTVLVGGEECVQETRTINICEPNLHMAEVNVEAMGSFGKNCEITGLIKFEILPPGTNPPTPRPTSVPTPRPTPRPSPAPSERVKTRARIPARKPIPSPTAVRVYIVILFERFFA
jgi:hypothetical protein